MKNILILLLLLVYVIPIQAQYCSMKKDRTAYYVTTDHKNGKILRDTLRIAFVVDKGDLVIVRENLFGDQCDSQSIKDDTNKQYYYYHKNKDMTEVIILDGNLENEKMRNYISSRHSPDQQKEAEKEYNEYAKHMRSEGRISVPLRDNVQDGEDIPPCSYMQKVGLITARGSQIGKYQGRERIHTPIGDFDCIKFYTERKMKMMLISETEYSTDWYAKNIGLVKSETITKKGKVLSTTLLNAIKE